MAEAKPGTNANDDTSYRDHVRQVAAAAPPLTDRQRTILRGLLASSGYPYRDEQAG
jgi:hypothetical protein